MTKRDGYKGLEFFERGDYKSKREFFRTLLLAFLSSQDFQLCLMRKLASLFIDDEVGLEFLRLKFFWNLSPCVRTTEALVFEVCRKEVRFFSIVRRE